MNSFSFLYPMSKKDDVVDLSPLPDRRKRYQSRWIGIFNEWENNFAIVPDFYEAVKYDDKISCEAFQRDCRSGNIVTATRIFYSPTSLEARVEHGVGSYEYHTRKNKVEIPIFSYVRIETVIATGKYAEAGLEFMRKLLETWEDPETIMGRLEQLSGMQRKNIVVGTPPLRSIHAYQRFEYSERGVHFFIKNNVFYIQCRGLPKLEGYAWQHV